MFTKALFGNTKKALAILGKSHLLDNAAMKIDAISTRGIKRDFIDLYFICQKGISLKEILLFYDRKYGTLTSNIVHIQKSLVYFMDAEMTAMPKILKKVDWKEVKKYFENEVRKLVKWNN